MAGVKDNELLKFNGFAKGVNNVDSEEGSPKQTLRAAVNIDIDNMGKMSRRQGFTLVANLPDAHSVWAHEDYDFMCLVQGGAIKVYDKNLTLFDQISLSRGLDPMSFTFAAGQAYYSNNKDIGKIDAVGGSMNWPIENPLAQPIVSTSNGIGGLTAGTYQVAVTFIDGDGVESGSTIATLIDVEEGDGISLAYIPQGSIDIAYTRIYRTEQNGDILYYAMDIPTGIQSALLGAAQLGKQLETQFLSPLPAGQILRYVNGRMLSASGDCLFWSESFNFGLTHLSQNYIRFNSAITMVEPVGHGDTTGIYLAAGDRTYYISGADPKSWQRSVVSGYGAVPNASCVTDAKLLGLDTTGLVPVWLSKDGALIAGVVNGVIVRLHDKHYLGKDGVEAGAMAMRNIKGITHLITTMQGGVANSAAASDSVESEVWKNGIRIA